jgi:cysteine-rich repeat protein
MLFIVGMAIRLPESSATLGRTCLNDCDDALRIVLILQNHVRAAPGLLENSMRIMSALITAGVLVSCMNHAAHAQSRATDCNASVGPDVIVGDLNGVSNYSSSGGVEALAIGTTSCNIGDDELLWIAENNQHPVIAQNLYRLKDGRIEQIGMSWLKHGFFALQQDLCCDCTPSNNGGDSLGVGCSDPYSSGTNGNQSSLGPRFQVNPFNGDFTYPPADPSYSGAIARRLQVKISDIDPAQDGGGVYFGEAQYVTPDDAAADNHYNNASYREITVSGGGSAWDFQVVGDTVREKPAISAWRASDPTVDEINLFVPGDGMFIVASKATDLGGGWRRYEYAVQNLNCERAIGSVTIPRTVGSVVANVGFHDVDYHSGEPFDGTDWSYTIESDGVTWETIPHATNENANAIRWGTLYNFRFDCNAAPETSDARFGMFKPGVPDDVAGGVVAPMGAAGVIDCNNNGVDDLDDIANGTSPDCNLNSIPDECEDVCELTSVRVASGLSQPVFVCAPVDDFDRLFIVEKTGAIRILDLTNGTLLGTPYLDVSSLLSSGGERGLLSMAFHPNYAVNGLFYVNYTNTAGDTVIAQYSVSGDPDVADAGSAVFLKTIDQPASNHNGGQLQFGPDGMLYVGMGDGGSGNDPWGEFGNGQNTGTLLGKMLRLDVDNPPNYIPADNPFVGAGDPLDEIWAIGMRNPWRFSFDRFTGDMYIADVGQNAVEEIDFESAASAGGLNYGWRCMEGSQCTGLTGCTCNDISLTLPILDVLHSDAGTCSITGGYVYRGCAIPGLSGTYFFADYCGDYVRSFRYDGATLTEYVDRTAELTPNVGSLTAIVSFGEDAAGELYIVSINGDVFQVRCADAAPVCGNGVLEPGEECDDGNDIPGDGCYLCQIEIPDDNDNCVNAVDIFDGDTFVDTTNATTDGPPHAPCETSGDSGQTYNDIWFIYTATCTGTVTVSTCGQADYDTDLVIYDGTDCSDLEAIFLGCNDDGGGCSGYSSLLEAPVVQGNQYLIRVGGWNSNNSGTATVTISCDGDVIPDGDPIRGGRMYDKWWAVNGSAAPTGDHPLYPPIGQQSGANTYRCKECHGWDYKGASGAYSSGSHYTGIPGILGSVLGQAEMFDLLKNDVAPNGHGFVNYGMSDQDIADIVAFVQTQLVDTDDYIDAVGLFLGDEVQGEVHYTTSGSITCVTCHGADGAAVNFGTPSEPEWVGTVARHNPWELLHKIRYGQPGTGMPSWIEGGGDTQGAADIGRYAQINFPTSPCPWDNAPDPSDGIIGLGDLNALLSNWGPCPAPCVWDFSPAGGDGSVGLGDLNAMLSNWGPCE